MEVREFLALLKNADPRRPDCDWCGFTLIVNPRAFGLPMETEEDEFSGLTEQDQEFLRSPTLSS